MTIGASFSQRDVKIQEDKVVKLDIWDTAGQERYRSLAAMYTRGATVGLVVVDLSVEVKLNEIESWLQEASVCKVIVLVG